MKLTSTESGFLRDSESKDDKDEVGEVGSRSVGSCDKYSRSDSSEGRSMLMGGPESGERASRGFSVVSTASEKAEEKPVSGQCVSRGTSVKDKAHRPYPSSASTYSLLRLPPLEGEDRMPDRLPTSFSTTR